MKKNLFVINENEKERIINMHKNATKNLYISENKLLTEERFKLVKIQLPDGQYIGSGQQGYEYKLLTPDKKDTGYIVKSFTPSRETVTDDPVTVSSGITTSKTWGVGGDYYYEAPISNAESTQQVVGQQEKPRYSKLACKTGTTQDCALALQQKHNYEYKPDILNATLVNFPAARTGTPGNYKLKEDSKLGSGTKAVIAACNLPKVGATPATPTPQSSVLNPTIPVGGDLTNNDIMTLMQQ